MIKKPHPKPQEKKRNELLDKRDFSRIEQEMEIFEKRRELVIKKSREIIKISKQIIYGIHRDDKNISKLITTIKEKVSKLRTRGELQFSSFYKVAMQEYVEAVAMYEVLKNHKLPSQRELFVSAPDYLSGLCDLTGELMRKANNLVIKNKSNEAIIIKDLVDDIYGGFLSLDIRDNDLRKKADQIKYNLRKLEDIAFHVARRKRK